MLALAEVEARTCAHCGGDLLETTTHDAWDVPPPLCCWRCEAIGVTQDAYQRDLKHPIAYRWTATRRG